MKKSLQVSVGEAQEGSQRMDTPPRVGRHSVSCVRSRGQYSAGRNRADERIRPCRMAEHKGETGQVHRSMVPVQVVSQRFGTNIS
jgi:hypothetical protein